MKKTNFTFRKQGEVGVKANSKFKVSLWFILFFLFMGMSSYMHAQCNITTVSFVEISLGSDGQHVITPGDVLQATGGSCGNLEAVVYDSDGNEILDNLIDCSFVGDTVTICVYEEGADHGNCMDCCSKAYICDLMPPVVECVNDTIPCFATDDPPFPIATDNCTDSADITFEVLSEEQIIFDCDPQFIGAVVREIRAVDASGNKSAICSDTLFTERFDMDLLEMPDSLTTEDSTELMCDESNWVDLNGNGYPDPGEPGVGSPTYQGKDVFTELPPICCVYFEYKDVEIQCPSCNCATRTIMRTYTAYEWWCGQEITHQYVQMIEIVDTTGPEVVAPNDFTVSANNVNCTATVIIPAAEVTEDCSDLGDYYVNYPGGFESLDEAGAVAIELTAGENTIYIEAYNACGLKGTDSLVVTVVDEAPPVANCDQNTVTSLGIDGTSRVYAETFDDGSYDNCGIDYIEVKRVDGKCDSGLPDEFGPYVEFCCNDLGQVIQVEFRVVDLAGNTNSCFVNVEVQDNIPPVLACPSDVEISCTYPIDLNDLSEFGTIEILSDPNEVNNVGEFQIDDVDNPEGGVTGMNGYAYDNCSVTIEESHTIELNECGNGLLVRTFSALDATGNVVQSCTQNITIRDFNPFSGEEDITWPANVTITNESCNALDLTPDYLEGLGYEGRPDLNIGECQSVGVTYSDDVFPMDDIACFKILRWWKVHDFCDDCDSCESYIHCQTITVKYDIPPTFTGNCDDITVASSDPDCNSRYVELTQSAESDCIDAGNLRYSYKIDLDNNGVFEISGTGNDASDDYGVGTHRIRWSAADNCGNVANCEYTFTVLNEKAGTPIAHNGIAVDLMSIDTNGDGEVDDATATINVDLLNRGSYHSCGYDFTLSFSADPTDVTRTFTCDDIGKVELEMWMHSENGTQSYVRTYILVQSNDPREPCGPGNSGPSSLVSGTISTTTDQMIPDVSVALQGTSDRIVSTNAQGEYSFGNVSDNQDYVINPEYDSGLLNGVSTWDLTLIQQHILGINDIVDPYTLIAADINNDKRITPLDLVDLRKAILGLSDGFPENTSWRFIDRDFNFDAQGDAVLDEAFPEMREIIGLNNDLYDMNFYGVKIGDINNNANITNLEGNADSRSASEIVAAIQNADFASGELVEVPVKANDLKSVLALQYSMSYNTALVEFKGVRSGTLEIKEDNYAHLQNGLVTMSWNDVEAQKLNEDETMYTIVFKAVQAGNLADAVEFNSNVTQSLVVENNEEKAFNVEFRGIAADNYALYQNNPNPVNGYTVIGISLPQEVEGTLTFYDMNGKTLKTIEKSFNQGYNEVSIDKEELSASGVVLYRFSSAEFSATKKMIILE